MSHTLVRHRGACAAPLIALGIACLQGNGVARSLPHLMRRAAAQGYEKAQLVLRLWDAVTNAFAATPVPP